MFLKEFVDKFVDEFLDETMSSYDQEAIVVQQQEPLNFQSGFFKGFIILSCALTQAINGIITIFSLETNCVIGGMIQVFAGIFVYLVEAPLFHRCMTPAGTRKGCSNLTNKSVGFKAILYSILAVASIASGCIKIAYIVGFLAASGIPVVYCITWIGERNRMKNQQNQENVVVY